MDSRRNQPARRQTTPVPHTTGGNLVEPPRPTKRARLDVSKAKPNDSTTDFKITCRGSFYFVHKSILCNRSRYFRGLFRFGGTETTNKEVVLNDYEAVTVEAVLSFMYSGSYKLLGGSIIPSGTFCTHRGSTNGGKPILGRIFKQKCLGEGKPLSPLHLLSHTLIYKLADYLMIEELKMFVRDRVIEVLHVHWQDKSLGLGLALQEAFSNTPDDDSGLREPLKDILKEHFSLWSDKGSVRSWLKAHPEVFKEVDDDFEWKM